MEQALESGHPFAIAIAVLFVVVWALRKWGCRVVSIIPWVGPRWAPAVGRWLGNERNVILLAVVGSVAATVLAGWTAGLGVWELVVAGIVTALGAMGGSNLKKIARPNVKDKEIQRLEELVKVKEETIEDFERAIRKKIAELPLRQRNAAARMSLDEELKDPK